MVGAPRSPCEDGKQENEGGSDDGERSPVRRAFLMLIIGHMALPSDIKNATVGMVVPDVLSPNRFIGS
jgi:hypothetical protein